MVFKFEKKNISMVIGHKHNIFSLAILKIQQWNDMTHPSVGVHSNFSLDCLPAVAVSKGDITDERAGIWPINVL